MTEKLRVGILREGNLNPWEMQNYAPIRDMVDFHLFSPRDHNYDISRLPFPIRWLDARSEMLRKVLHPGRTLRRWAESKMEKRFYYVNELDAKVHNLDILHTVDLKARMTYTGAYLKRKYGFALIVTVWENIPFLHETKPRWKSMWEVSSRQADRIIAVTEGAREALLLEGVPVEKISVIPYGVDIERFSPGAKDPQLLRHYDIRSQSKIVLFAGRMVYEKGVTVLLHAARYILQRTESHGGDLIFLLAGSGEEEGTAKKMAAGYGLERSIKFIRSVPYENIHALYRLADVFVLPSLPVPGWQEQFGMVLVEAMACGRAIVGTLSGSIPEVVGDAGVLVPPGDWRTLAEAIVKLVRDDGRRKALEEKARLRAAERFNAVQVGERILSVYESLSK